MVKTACYRVGQFFRALTARVSEEEVEQAMGVLTPQAQTLFRRQATQDQHHALAVYRALLRAGHTNRHLLAAALLHDAGKAEVLLPAWQRAVIVLLNRFAPRLLRRLSRGEPRGWNRPFVAHARHPELGARRAHEANCSPLTVALIQHHQDRMAGEQTERDRLLAALQAADNLN